ncbi:MFS transporter, MHS family, proline/betaine transporter [Amycolatopsis tolypomycina]|uniref:Putative proline/betaine transporter n=1 Tax=Amycolatopsis tolypomycina TaxID=208445 RepID=A0A1H5AHB2_9PSEU|nr:glycine betaine/L-proline transporter ProP [Amycolatopsis tolypomycina]SED41816.1 MFS transporter, MHS family, proline/betaine transporter [Amycolatopsis tolypomycina]
MAQRAGLGVSLHLGVVERSGAKVRGRKKKLRYEDITVVDQSLLKRAVGAAALGNAMEWFDFGVYAYIADTIAEVFFPASVSPGVRLIGTFGAFTAAFLMRPLGGLVFGPLGDRIGRQKVLAVTMIMMAIGTLCIGLIPSYSSIGVWSPILLVLARMVQGFSTGGEYGGATTFIAEYSPDKRRGFMGSWLEFGTLSGYVLGASVVTGMKAWVPHETLLDWGWRVPFLVAGPLGIIGLYMRLKLEETPAFQKHAEEAEKRGRSGEPFWKMFTQYWPALLICVGLVLVFNVTDYMLLSYMPTYLSEQLHLDATHGLLLIIVVMVVMMLIIMVGGRITDHVGRKPVMMAGCLGFLVLSWPLMLLVHDGGLVLTFLGLMGLGLLLLCFEVSMPAALPALFPTAIRYGALSIAFNISVSLFGGTTPLVMQSLISATGHDFWPAWYLMAAGAIGAVAVFFSRETANKPLWGSGPAVSTEAEARELVRGSG